MKLHELGAQRPTEQVAKTLEAFMGDRISFDRLSESQARYMLQRTKNLLKEYKTSVSRHFSERNPDYLKLVMLEQALSARLSETDEEQEVQAALDPSGVAKTARATGTQQVGQLGKAMGAAASGKALDPNQRKAMTGLAKGLGSMMNDPQQSTRLQQLLRTSMSEEQVDEKYMGFGKTVKAIKKGGSARDPEAVAAAIGRKKYGKEKFQKAAAAGKKLGENRRRLREASDVQQAQVVMAAQDMVDQIQKMMEQISSMQFKDLPALVDAIKNEVGVDQANRFQADATAALSSLLQAVQGGKTQMEQAQGVLTGQAPVVPGADAGADINAAPLPAGELGAEGGEDDMDLGLDANLPPEEEEGDEAPAASLGRERR